MGRAIIVLGFSLIVLIVIAGCSSQAPSRTSSPASSTSTASPASPAQSVSHDVNSIQTFSKDGTSFSVSIDSITSSPGPSNDYFSLLTVNFTFINTGTEAFRTDPVGAAIITHHPDKSFVCSDERTCNTTSFAIYFVKPDGSLDGYATILSPGVSRKGTITQSFEKRRYEALKQGMSISFIGLNIYSLAGDNFRSYQYNNKDIVFPTWEIDFAKDVTILPAKASSVTVTATPDQKAQETVYKGVEQSTANIQMIGNVYGLASNPSTGIDEIRFSIGLAPGAAPVDLTGMRIVFSTPTISPIILAQGATASTSVFTTKLNGASNVNSMNANNQIEIAFKVSPVSANTKMIVELRPPVGAALPFSKTAPVTISATNVLY